jgi:hypothetical protein
MAEQDCHLAIIRLVAAAAVQAVLAEMQLHLEAAEVVLDLPLVLMALQFLGLAVAVVDLVAARQAEVVALAVVAGHKQLRLRVVLR